MGSLEKRGHGLHDPFSSKVSGHAGHLFDAAVEAGTPEGTYQLAPLSILRVQRTRW